MRHLKRLVNGLVAYGLVYGFIMAAALVAVLIVDFFGWKYRDRSLLFMGFLVFTYIVGYLGEKL